MMNRESIDLNTLCTLAQKNKAWQLYLFFAKCFRDGFLPIKN